MKEPLLPKPTGIEVVFVGMQARVYGTTRKDEMRFFSYDLVELADTYKTTIIDPFLKRARELSNDPLILDLGSGCGEAGRYIDEQGGKVVSVDINTTGLRQSLRPVRASAWRLPFADETFDGIHSKDMISHIHPYFRQLLFHEVNRILKPSGECLIVGAQTLNSAVFQYSTYRSSLLKDACFSGLIGTEYSDWKPSAREQSTDWYKSRKNRFVIQLNKPVSPLEDSIDY